MSENKTRISDEDFMRNYDRHNKQESRSDKYVKGKESSIKGFGFVIFLMISFLIAYYIFSKFLFPPQI